MEQQQQQQTLTRIDLESIAKFLAAPHSFQLEKVIRKLCEPDFAYHLDGINDIPQVGFAVAMERKFHYDLHSKLGYSSPGYNYLGADFLQQQGFLDDSSQGVKMYFGLDIEINRLVPIIAKVTVTGCNPFNATDLGLYYTTQSADNGYWNSIDANRFEELRHNYRDAVAQITQFSDPFGREKYVIQGYYIGRDAIRNVLSDSIAPQYGKNIMRAGIKIYFGIQDDIFHYDYEVGKTVPGDGPLFVVSTNRELHLILVGVDDPKSGPLASFSRVFATIETDAQTVKEGVTRVEAFHRILGNGAPCIVPDKTITSE